MKTLSPEEIEAINPGIRSTVLKLREWGYDTCDSGDGVTHDYGCDMPMPFVHIKVDPIRITYETLNLYNDLRDAGINFTPPPDVPHPQDDPEAWAKHPTIEASYSPVDGFAFITITNVVLP